MGRLASAEGIVIVILGVALALAILGVFEGDVSCADGGVASFVKESGIETAVGERTGKTIVQCQVMPGGTLQASIEIQPASPRDAEPANGDGGEPAATEPRNGGETPIGMLPTPSDRGLEEPLACVAELQTEEGTIRGPETTIEEFGEQIVAPVDVPQDLPEGTADLVVSCEDSGGVVFETEQEIAIEEVASQG